MGEGVSFCPNCGTAAQAAQQPAPQQPAPQQPAPQQPVYQQPIYQQPNYQQAPVGYPPVVFVEEPPMKWFKFLIYFSLWAGAVLNAITAIGMLTGSIYGAEAELVYAVFSDLKGLDTLMGVLSLALAAFGIFTRFRLAGYKRNGPLMLMIVYIASALLNLIYVIGLNAALPSIALEMIDTTSAYSSIISSVVMVIVNHIYFKKRSHLFIH